MFEGLRGIGRHRFDIGGNPSRARQRRRAGNRSPQGCGQLGFRIRQDGVRARCMSRRPSPMSMDWKQKGMSGYVMPVAHDDQRTGNGSEGTVSGIARLFLR